jgi:hypothetical protein
MPTLPLWGHNEKTSATGRIRDRYSGAVRVLGFVVRFRANDDHRVARDNFACYDVAGDHITSASTDNRHNLNSARTDTAHHCDVIRLRRR